MVGGTGGARSAFSIYPVDDLVVVLLTALLGTVPESASFGKSMLRRLPTALVLIASLVVASGAAAQTTPNLYRDELQPLIENFMHQQQVPGLTIGVIQGDRLVYAHGLA